MFDKIMKRTIIVLCIALVGILGWIGVIWYQDTSETEFMKDLHHMTHQKVEASQKWGSEEITDEKIDEMLAILDREDFENESFYREALTAWDKGDFLNAVEVHNTIWNWQGGTIGKATGLLSPEEELEYIEENF